MTGYSIQKTGNTTYIGPAGNVINGFLLTVLLVEFNETLLLNVPSLNADVVKTEIEKVLEQRKALANLGQEE